MNKRLTLVTLFDIDILNQIEFLVKQHNINTCKLPYGIDNNNRKALDTLPYHFTISAWDDSLKKKVIEMLSAVEFSNMTITIDNVELMNGRENSYVLYLSSKNDIQLKEFLKIVYSKLPSEKYNPETFTFHITLDIDKDYEKVNNLKNKILGNFKPFDITINALGLFEIYPANLIYEKLED